MNVQVILKNDVERKTVIADNSETVYDIVARNGFETDKSYAVQGEVVTDLDQPLTDFDSESEQFLIVRVSKTTNAME